MYGGIVNAVNLLCLHLQCLWENVHHVLNFMSISLCIQYLLTLMNQVSNNRLLLKWLLIKVEIIILLNSNLLYCLFVCRFRLWLNYYFWQLKYLLSLLTQWAKYFSLLKNFISSDTNHTFPQPQQITGLAKHNILCYLLFHRHRIRRRIWSVL